MFKYQPVYLKNEFEEAVIKYMPGPLGKRYVKFKGKEEQKISASSDLVVDTLLEVVEITEQEYNNY